MEYDAFRAGVEPGGLINRTEIRLLVCYILKSIDQPISGRLIQELFHYEGLANYFEVGQAVVDLEKAGHIRLADAENGTYTISDSGKDIADTLERDLPRSVREKAVKSAVKMLTRIRREQENKVKIVPLEKGYLVSCSVLEFGAELMTVRLHVPDQLQAEAVKQNFLEDPSLVYTGVIELMTHEKLPYTPEDPKL